MFLSRYSHLWAFVVAPNDVDYNVMHSDVYLKTGFFDCPERSYGLRVADQLEGEYSDYDELQGRVQVSCKKGV